jgi:hypothetical protein
VGITAGSREVPGRKPVKRDNNNNNNNNNNQYPFNPLNPELNPICHLLAL